LPSMLTATPADSNRPVHAAAVIDEPHQSQVLLGRAGRLVVEVRPIQR
jgi:hypothetical protein